MKAFARTLFGLTIALFLVSLAPYSPVLAATINVPCSNVPALIAAVQTANTTPEPDTIQLTPGCTYTLLAPDNSSPELGPNGLPVITSKIVIQGGVIERQEDAPKFRMFQVAPTGMLVLKSLSFVYGSTPMTEIPDVGYSGGAIYNDGGKVKLKGVFFDFTSSSGDGGLIYNSEGRVVAKQFSSRRAHTEGRGGIFNSAGSKLEIKSGDYWLFSAASGGVIYNEGQADIENVSFRNVKASFEGDGIFNLGALTINSSTFNNNGTRPNGTLRGGAILNDGTLQITNSTFRMGSAKSGGAIFNQGSAMIANSTFFWNKSDRNGGAILNRGTLDLVNATLYYNQTSVSRVHGMGGSLYTASGVTTVVANTIISGGTAQNCFGALDDRGGNLRFPQTDGTCIGDFGDPRLEGIASYGGPTFTMALKPGSAAINHGIASICLDSPVNNRDQRGVTRIMGDEETCDAGAYEVE